MNYDHYYAERPQMNMHGQAELHRDGCDRLPGVDKRVYLGMFRDLSGARDKAEQLQMFVIGCRICAPQSR